MKSIILLFSVSLFLFALGCENSREASNLTDSATLVNATNVPTPEGSPQIVIEPGPAAQTTALEALILAEPGDVIEFAEGTFNFDGTLSLDGVENVTIRGKGMQKTILNFAKFQAGKGGEGLKIKANNFTIEDLTIEDTPGDAIKLQDCVGITMRRVRTWWTGGPDTKNGAYGLYPVLSTNVLIEHCVAEGASDAGIYVGQSKQVIVRHCVVEKNVAGIEIENCIGADVYKNVANNNTGGILVFSLPGLTIKNGSDCRVFDNEVASNNHPNFAETGAMVAAVPPGTGLMIMANDRVEAFNNKFDGNDGASCLIVSFLSTQRKFDDSEYDPYPEAIHIHDNQFTDGGSNARGEFLEKYADATGKPVPDIVFDGVLDPAKLTEGRLSPERRFLIQNGDATFVNLDLGKMLSGEEPKYDSDLSPYEASGEPFGGSAGPIKAVVIPGLE